MIRLVYTSRARPGVDDLTAEIILARSRPANRAAGITGLLVFDGARFLQMLEGPPAAVGETYARIRADRRHEGCAVLDRGEVAGRAFADWDMAWRRILRHEERDELERSVAEMVVGIDDRALASVFARFATGAGATSSRTPR